MLFSLKSQVVYWQEDIKNSEMKKSSTWYSKEKYLWKDVLRAI